MSDWYPYRFKTLEEFRKDKGDFWRDPLFGCGFVESMDYLFGQPYPYNIDLDKLSDDSYLPDMECSRDIFNRGFWIIRKFMLTKNEIRVPNYKPRKIERSL